MKFNSQFRLLTTQEELLKLRDSISRHLPRSGTFLNVPNLKILGKFSTTITQADFYIYEENGNREESFEDPFVVCIQRNTIHSPYAQCIWAPQNPSPESIKTFEDFIQWDKSHIFSFVDQAFVDNHLLSLCRKYGVMADGKSEGHPCEFFILAPDISLDSPDPSNEFIQVRDLEVKVAAELTRNYYWAQPHTQTLFGDVIQNLTSCGLYVNGELACSTVFSPSGLINALWTDPNHRRKGYGVIVMRAMASRILKMGLIPMAEAELWNQSSKHLIQKSGFSLVGHTNWICFKSNQQ